MISVRGPLCSQSHGCKALPRCRKRCYGEDLQRRRRGFVGTIRPHTENSEQVLSVKDTLLKTNTPLTIKGPKTKSNQAQARCA